MRCVSHSTIRCTPKRWGLIFQRVLSLCCFLMVETQVTRNDLMSCKLQQIKKALRRVFDGHTVFIYTKMTKGNWDEEWGRALNCRWPRLLTRLVWERLFLSVKIGGSGKEEKRPKKPTQTWNKGSSKSHGKNLPVLPGTALVVCAPALETPPRRAALCSVPGWAQALCSLNCRGETLGIQKRTGFVTTPTR